MDKLRYELITASGVNIRVFDKINLSFSDTIFNTISFKVKDLNNPEDLINQIIVYKIYLNNSISEEMYFVVTDYKKVKKFGEEYVEFTGYTKTYFCSEAYFGLINDEYEYNNLFELFNFLNSLIAQYNIYIEPTFNYPLTNNEISTKDRTIPQILSSIQEILGISFVSNKKGDKIYPLYYKYTQDDIGTFKNFSMDNLILLKEESFQKENDYNRIIVTNLSNLLGEIILETEEETYNSYHIYIYTSPLISTFDSINVTASDGNIGVITPVEDFMVEEFLNFQNDSAKTKYPIKDVVSIEFYNIPNTLIWNIGQSELSINTSDDLCVAKIVYTTERAHYFIDSLVEPYVKIKAEVIKND